MENLESKLIPVSSFRSLGARLGIFGGSFDPIHNGHIRLAELAKKTLKLDKIIFIPTNKNPLKPSAPIASNSERLEMLSLALQNEEGFCFSDLECLNLEPNSYSVETVNKIKEQLSSEQQLFFLIGADQIATIHL